MKKYDNVLLYAIAINLFIVWGIVAAFIIEHLNNFVGYILAFIIISIEFYAHIIAFDFIKRRQENK